MARDAGAAKLPREFDRETSHAALPEGLSKELAQLLAASIAKHAATKGPPGSVPTGSDLASLASLVSSVAARRGLSPTFKDGLSALAYEQPPKPYEPQPKPYLGQASTEPHPDDEPMPIPSTWREPPPSDDDRWYRQQMGAAVMGLVAGLMVVVPAVLWLSGRLGGPQKAKGVTETAMAEARSAEIKVVKVPTRQLERPPEVATPYVTAAIEPRATLEAVRPAPPPVVVAQPIPVPAPVAALPPPVAKAPPPVAAAPVVAVPPPIAVRAPEPPRLRFEDVRAQAQRRIDVGDVMGAREILAGSEPVSPGQVAFALAETYDPNMLAAWGTRGISADVDKARALYRRAQDLGISHAQSRLQELR
jgi:hypothetical protein